MIVLNLKTYPLSLKETARFAKVCKEVSQASDVRIVLVPPVTSLSEALHDYSDVFSQHVDDVEAGAHTGSVPVEALVELGVCGSLVSHSERKLPHETVRKTLERLHSHKLESIACADSIDEARVLAGFNPTYVAVEPPELIGSGISVSNAQPEIVTGTIAAIKKANPKVRVLCGAGVSNAEDVKNALKLGVEGVLLASAFVKAKDPKKFLESLVEAFA